MILEVFLHSLFITGLVVIMMMMIESLNIESKGAFFSGLKQSRIGGVLTASLLGAIPGCMGGFATVSLYTHGMLSFGALVAMMIASCGDEAFVMLAMMPKDALWIFAIIFGIAILTGILTDLIFKKPDHMHCPEHLEVHTADRERTGREKRTYGWKRILMIAGIAAFIIWLILDNDEPDEKWLHLVFAVLSLSILAVLALASDHFVEEHLWHHVVLKHLPRIFAWTFCVLLVIEVIMGWVDIESWISGNTALMILLAAAIGIIPESGPHLIFVTLYASGVIPLPVLLASCISQDGHASLPLLAESKKSFLKAKAVNVIVALVVGFGTWMLG